MTNKNLLRRLKLLAEKFGHCLLETLHYSRLYKVFKSKKLIYSDLFQSFSAESLILQIILSNFVLSFISYLERELLFFTKYYFILFRSLTWREKNNEIAKEKIKP